MAATDIYSVCGSMFPVRHSLRALGGAVDDGVRVQALAQAVVAGNHTKGTFTAWVMVIDDVNTYGVLGFGDTNAAEYMQIDIVAGKLQFVVYDGGATRVSIITTNALIKPHRWHHIAVVQDGSRPWLYVDGELAAMTDTTSTELSQWFDDTDGIDDGYIGCNFSTAGGGLLTEEFAGYISDVKLWSGTTAAKALSAEQIKNEYNGVNTTGVLAWYKFDGNALDYGTGGGTYDGTVTGAMVYVDANEFASRLSFGCGIPVTGDNVSISVCDGYGFAVVIQAA